MLIRAWPPEPSRVAPTAIDTTYGNLFLHPGTPTLKYSLVPSNESLQTEKYNDKQGPPLDFGN
jgi:hypothetical protein